MKVLVADDEASVADELAAELTRNERLHVDPRRVTPDGLLHCLESGADLPTVVVLDVYSTKHTPGTPDAEDVNREVERLISDVRRALDRLAPYVSANKRSAGIDALSAIRKHPDPRIRDLGVVLATRYGLNLLSERELVLAHDAGTHWMLKEWPESAKQAAVLRAGKATERAHRLREVEQALDRKRRIEVALAISTAVGWILAIYQWAV